MRKTVTASVDSAGRLVFPEDIRQDVGLRPGTAFEVSISGDRIEMEPTIAAQSPEVRVVRKGRLTVAEASDDLPLLTEQEVLALRGELRCSRSEV